MNFADTDHLPANLAADEVVLRTTAARWRRANFEGNIFFSPKASEGFVVFAERQAAGWTGDLLDPRRWVPGCLAVPTAGEIFVSRGGNDEAGAREWIPWSAATKLRWGRPVNWLEELAALREFARLKAEMNERECGRLMARLSGWATIFDRPGELLNLPPLKLLEVAKDIVAERDDRRHGAVGSPE